MGYRLSPEEKARRAERRRAVVNPFKPGEIVVSTWGYDQTNADFYRVIRTTSKACVLRRIGSIETESKPGAMRGTTVPDPKYREDSDGDFLARLVPSWRDNEEPYVNTNHGAARRWDGNPVAVSWYG